MSICPLFGKCGGCSCQHIDYSIQLENKKKQLMKALDTRDIFSTNEIKVFSDQPFNYRNRMDFFFFPRGVGLRNKNSASTIIDVEECPISNAGINQLLAEVRKLEYLSGLNYVILRSTSIGDSGIVFVIDDDAADKEEIVRKLSLFDSSAKNITIAYAEEEDIIELQQIKGSWCMEEELLGKKFIFPIAGFFQNNSTVAQKMHQYVHELISTYDTKNMHLLDLYGGVGTFGINNAHLFKSTLIVENYAPAIEAAKKNIEQHKVNAQAICAEAKSLKKVSFPLFVITDPPRSGMESQTIYNLNKWLPEVIIYISCNPQQLKKDMAKLKGYKINSAALFDMFTQTNHAEAVVELVKKD